MYLFCDHKIKPLLFQYNEEPIQTLTTLSNLLESAQFGEFWQEAKTYKEMLDKIPGFDDAIRNCKYTEVFYIYFIVVSGVVASTYKTIAKDFFSEVLNLKGTELDQYVNSKGWKQTTDAVTFPNTEESSSKAKKNAENIKFQGFWRLCTSFNCGIDLTKIMAQMGKDIYL